MGLIHASQAGGLRWVEVAHQPTAVTGGAATATYTLHLPHPFIVHGFLLGIGSGATGTTTNDWPYFSFEVAVSGKTTGTTIALGSGAINILSTLYGQLAANPVNSIVWVPAVQARRYALGYETDIGSIIFQTATSTTAWPSGFWLGATTNNGRCAPTRISSATVIPYLKFAINQAPGSTKDGTVTNVRATALITAYPYEKYSVTDYSTAEIVAADEAAYEAVLGGRGLPGVWGLQQL